MPNARLSGVNIWKLAAPPKPLLGAQRLKAHRQLLL